MCGTDIFLLVLAVLFPPIGVWVKRGICSADSLINLALCILGFLPGLLHAWYIILKYPDPDTTYQRVPQGDAEAGNGNTRVTYYYVSPGQPQHPAGAQRQAKGAKAVKGQAQPQGYGTISGGSGQSGVNQQFPGQETGKANAFAGAAPQSNQSLGGASSSRQQDGEAPPPSYAAVVAGDHKVQTSD